MAKRSTVAVDYEEVCSLIKQKHWSQASFAEMVGKHRTWIANVKLGKNLPSPEEAAQMCAILQCDPEEIITDAADVELVRGLISDERQAQESRSVQSAEVNAYLDQLKSDSNYRILFDLVNNATLEEVKATVAFLETLRNRRDN